jgi:hypothetical protein
MSLSYMHGSGPTLTPNKLQHSSNRLHHLNDTIPPATPKDQRIGMAELARLRVATGIGRVN